LGDKKYFGVLGQGKGTGKGKKACSHIFSKLYPNGKKNHIEEKNEKKKKKRLGVGKNTLESFVGAGGAQK